MLEILLVRVRVAIIRVRASDFDVHPVSPKGLGCKGAAGKGFY